MGNETSSESVGTNIVAGKAEGKPGKVSFFNRIPKPGGRWIMFILFLSLLVVCDYCFRFFAPKMTDEILNFLNYVDYFVCFFFFIDVSWRFLISENKWRFCYTWGWIDLLASIPPIHIFRAFKIFYIFSLIRGVRSFQRVTSFLFATKVSISLLFSCFLFFSSIAVASVCELYFEQGAPHATITSMERAIWWALMIASTVGDTNDVPVTTAGMIVGFILTIIGYGIFSVNAGLMATWLQNNINTVQNKTDGK